MRVGVNMNDLMQNLENMARSRASALPPGMRFSFRQQKTQADKNGLSQSERYGEETENSQFEKRPDVGEAGNSQSERQSGNEETGDFQDAGRFGIVMTGESSVSDTKQTSDCVRLENAMNLQEAVLWAEILGEPVSKKRRRERMEKVYGNSGYVGRR